MPSVRSFDTLVDTGGGTGSPACISAFDVQTESHTGSTSTCRGERLGGQVGDESDAAKAGSSVQVVGS